MSILSVIESFLGGPSTPTTTTAAAGATQSSGGILGAITGAITSGTTAAEDTAGMFGTMTAFLGALSDAKMWRSLGWIVLGLILIVMGFVLWAKGDLAPPERKRAPVAF